MPINQEREKSIQKRGGGEKVDDILVDVGKGRVEKGLDRKVANWLEEIEKAPKQTTITDDKQQVLKPVGGGQVKVKLPVTRKTFKSGFSKTVADAGRWLSEFIFRLIKIKKGKVKFKNDDN